MACKAIKKTRATTFPDFCRAVNNRRPYRSDVTHTFLCSGNRTISVHRCRVTCSSTTPFLYFPGSFFFPSPRRSDVFPLQEMTRESRGGNGRVRTGNVSRSSFRTVHSRFCAGRKSNSVRLPRNSNGARRNIKSTRERSNSFESFEGKRDINANDR